MARGWGNCLPVATIGQVGSLGVRRKKGELAVSRGRVTESSRDTLADCVASCGAHLFDAAFVLAYTGVRPQQSRANCSDPLSKAAASRVAGPMQIAHAFGRHAIDVSKFDIRVLAPKREGSDITPIPQEVQFLANLGVRFACSCFQLCSGVIAFVSSGHNCELPTWPGLRQLRVGRAYYDSLFFAQFLPSTFCCSVYRSEHATAKVECDHYQSGCRVDTAKQIA